MKKILKIALIVILIIALVVGGYFIALNVTKTQTKSLKKQKYHKN